MRVEEAIQTLLAVRSYTSQPVPDEVIRSILEAGRLTASSMNKQPWHFVVVQGREALTELAGTTPHGPYIAGAAFAVVVAVDKASPFGLSDASRAVQDMMLVAWEQGVGSNWVGLSGMLGQTSALLGIPDNLDVVCIVPFGYPAQATGKGRKQRKPLDEIVHWDRW